MGSIDLTPSVHVLEKENYSRLCLPTGRSPNIFIQAKVKQLISLAME